MSDELQALEEWAGVLLGQLEPAARTSLARSIAQQLRRSQQQRIFQQRNPDGSKFAPRMQRDIRGKKGRIKRQRKMFQKLRTVNHLKLRSDSNVISIGFIARAARIARVHQYGLKDRAQLRAPEVIYQCRKILGLSESDREIIRDGILSHLSD